MAEPIKGYIGIENAEGARAITTDPAVAARAHRMFSVYEEPAELKQLLTDLTVAVDRYMQCDERPRPASLWKAMGVAVEAAGEVVYPL